jgi:hypothetical protein
MKLGLKEIACEDSNWIQVAHISLMAGFGVISVESSVFILVK